MSDASSWIWSDSMPAAYDELLGDALFQPYAEDTAARAAALLPARILELAAGTGRVTRLLAEALPEAEISASDLNPAMVSFGKQHVPSVEWRVADALALPFNDAQFDLAVCQFGVMFFPDKPAGFAEARRVLKPGGHLLFVVWDTIDANAIARLVQASVDRLMPGDPPTFLRDTPYGYADTDRVKADVAAGGLKFVSVETVTLEGPARSAADVAEGLCTGSPLRAAIEARADLDVVVAAVREDATRQYGDGPVTLPMQALVYVARRDD